MYPIEYQGPLPSDVLVHHYEHQRKIQRDTLQELYPVKRLNRKPILSNLALTFANLMIGSGQQLKERYQLT